MKLTDILLHENAKYPKISLLDKVKSIQQSHPNAYVTYHTVLKFGIHPTTDYATPTGIYAYPIAFVIAKKGIVEFPDTSKYITVFTPAPSATIWNVSDPTEDMRDRIIQALSDLNIDAHQSLVTASDNRAAWYGMYSSIQNHIISMGGDVSDSGHSQAVVAGKVLRRMGVDVVVDNGSGIIHHNEPTQAIFLTTRACSIIETFRNSFPPRPGRVGLPHPSDDEIRKLIKQAFDTNRRSNYLERHVAKFNKRDIRTNMDLMIRYARHFELTRWPELEPFILAGPDVSIYMYIVNVLRRRWIAGEPKLSALNHEGNHTFMWTDYAAKYIK